MPSAPPDGVAMAQMVSILINFVFSVSMEGVAFHESKRSGMQSYNFFCTAMVPLYSIFVRFISDLHVFRQIEKSFAFLLCVMRSLDYLCIR